ncbi:hypothetical protein TYRP_017184 [Tyrophagus putrescentiae]|nr:hypothetical protein TYRP_017184 [Tyrophagus putrescentiae]
MSALQILCVLVVATTLLSQYEAKPDYTLKELKDLCDSKKFKYCRQYIRTTPSMDFITPKVDFRKYYGPAESQSYPGWIYGLFKKDCNSGWAFAGAGVLEGVFNWKTNQGPVSLSKQELLECVYAHGGCRSSPSFMALYYIQGNGICKTKDFGYRFESGSEACISHRSSLLDLYGVLGHRFDSPHFFQNAFEYNRLEKNANAKTIMEVIEKYGPVSVAVSVGKEFNDYKYWALSSSDVQVSGGTEHSVVVVGYGEPDYFRKPYWIIRNSYGPDWGTNGYGLLEQTEDASEINREVIYISDTKF